MTCCVSKDRRQGLQEAAGPFLLRAAAHQASLARINASSSRCILCNTLASVSIRARATGGRSGGIDINDEDIPNGRLGPGPGAAARRLSCLR